MSPIPVYGNNGDGPYQYVIISCHITKENVELPIKQMYSILQFLCEQKHGNSYMTRDVHKNKQHNRLNTEQDFKGQAEQNRTCKT